MILTCGEMGLSCSSLMLTRAEVKQRKLHGGVALRVSVCAVNNFNGVAMFVRTYVHQTPCLKSFLRGKNFIR